MTGKTLEEALFDGTELAEFDHAERRNRKGNRKGELEGWVIYGAKPPRPRIAPPPPPDLGGDTNEASAALAAAVDAWRRNGPPPRRELQPRPCKGRTCRALVLLVPTEASGGVKELPLNPQPDDGGNVVILNGLARVLGPLYVRDPRWDGHRYRTHFDTCPDAQRFRNRKSGRR